MYQALKERADNRNISNLINEISVNYFVKKESMFGTMRITDISDLRDHRDRE